MAKKFFVSTAIDYPTAKPHCGHLYEKVCTDAIARWHRLKGEKVHFSTGLDCHGKKMAQKAAQVGQSPADFVKSMATHYRRLCADYSISYDDFIQTTEARHKPVVYALFKKIKANGDIYKGSYEGLYCVDCETFYTETEAENGKYCPTHRQPLQITKEESYFFQMSKYQSKLIKLLKNPTSLWPKERRNEMLKRLEEPLRDLSISRTSLDWGIPFPNDSKHVFYCWLDALTNYLTTIDYPNQKFKEFWPANAHVIGRDIVWHHTVIWWSLLMSAGLPLPQVVSHGFINTKTGDKMSKSAGNTIDSDVLAERFGADSVRYFLLREIPFRSDGKFSEEALINRHNNELANELGNLVSRVTALIIKKCNGLVSKQPTEDSLFAQLKLEKIAKYYDAYQFNRAIGEIFVFVGACNKYINEQEPWKLDGLKAEIILYNLVDALRVIAILLTPVMPCSCEKIRTQLSLPVGCIADCQPGNLTKANVQNTSILFPKIEYTPPIKPKVRPISVIVDYAVKKLGLKIVSGIVENVKIKKKHEGLEKLKEKTVAETNLNDSRRQQILRGYEEIYQKLNVQNVVNSVHNLDTLVQKAGQLPQINTAVDAYNVVSLKFGLVVGCHDIDRVNGNLRFGITKGDEQYIPLDENTPKKVAKDEFAVLDANQIVCRLDEKQCASTKITERSKHLVFYIQGNQYTSNELLKKAAREVGELITKYCGGEFHSL